MSRNKGFNAQEGSEYQRTYALMLACQMLNEPKKTLAIRWEGAQDIDLKLCDGTDLCIQTKNEATETISLSSLASVFVGFAHDINDAGEKPIRFRFVARKGRLDAA